MAGNGDVNKKKIKNPENYFYKNVNVRLQQLHEYLAEYWQALVFEKKGAQKKEV